MADRRLKSAELRAEDSSGGYSQGEWIQNPTVQYRTQKQKFKNQADEEDSENNEGLILKEELNVWTVEIQCNCNRNIQ
jgi:hypothetical protein